MKIYISGPITKNPYYRRDFIDAEAMLHGKYRNSEIINPIFLTSVKNGSWDFYMRVCLKALADCDTIYMLRGWWKSRGARLEWLIAKKLNMRVIFER